MDDSLSTLSRESLLTVDLCTIEIDGQPIVMLSAENWRTVQSLDCEEWFRADLSLLTCGGFSLADATSELHARDASASESARFAEHFLGVERYPDALEMFWLVRLDDAPWN